MTVPGAGTPKPDSSAALLQRLTTLRPMIAARVSEIEAARHLPADLAAAMAEAGVFRMLVPGSMGGLELPVAAAMEVLEQLGAADASVGWCAMIGATSALPAAYLEPAVAREIFGRPGTIAGGVYAPMGKAVLQGDHYRLDGRWQWASGSANCHWLMGGAMVFAGGKPRLLPGGLPDTRMLLFPAGRARLIDSWHVAGLCGTGSGEMEVADLLVPATHSVSLVGDRPREPGPLYVFPVFGLLALGIAAVMLGNAAAAIADLVSLAGGKVPQGGRKRLADRALAQIELARAEAELRAARAFYYRAIETAWARASGAGIIEPTLRAELRLAATHAVRTAAMVTRSMYDLGGGSALFLASPLQRRFRDAHAGTQHMMVAPATYELVGRVLMGVPTDTSQL